VFQKSNLSFINLIYALLTFMTNERITNDNVETIEQINQINTIDRKYQIVTQIQI